MWNIRADCHEDEIRLRLETKVCSGCRLRLRRAEVTWCFDTLSIVMKVTTPRINFLSPRLTQVNRKRWLLVASHISAADWPSSSIPAPSLIFQYLDSPYLVASTFIIYLYIQCPCSVRVQGLHLVLPCLSILFSENWDSNIVCKCRIYDHSCSVPGCDSDV